MKHGLRWDTTLSSRVLVLEEWPTAWIISLVITTVTDQSSFVNHQVSNYKMSKHLSGYIIIVHIFHILCNHVRDTCCDVSNLLLELVPFRHVSIWIAQISYVKNNIIVVGILDKRISCVESSMLIFIVFIWSISFWLQASLSYSKEWAALS